jgi:hypothetical protein
MNDGIWSFGVPNTAAGPVEKHGPGMGGTCDVSIPEACASGVIFWRIIPHALLATNIDASMR